MTMVASKEMNLSELRKAFVEEFNFISEAFSRCQWPKPVESDEESDDDENEEARATTDDEDKDIDDSNDEVSAGPTKVTNLKESQSRAGTIKELLEKHNEIRSKENRKRKKEVPKKSKHKNKKKKKKTDDNSASSAKPAVKKGTPNQQISTEDSTSNTGAEPNQEETKDKKPNLKRTRAPIKHGADVIVNQEGQMLFSKIAFSDSVDELKPKLGGPKQPKHVLGKLEKMNNLISSLEERGKKEKAQRLKENMSWSNAFFKAEGAKVKDNTNKVQKSVKQLAKRKRASERKWKKRLEDIKTKKETKDKKRDSHIQKRVDQKKERKLKKLIKRGRFIPELKTKPS